MDSQFRTVDGSGIKIGIVSDSFNTLGGAFSDIENGELPGKQNPFNRSLSINVLKDLNDEVVFATDEGRALAQTIHDIAPGSELFFHTVLDNYQEKPFADADSFSQAVKALKEADVDIIVDDVVLLDSLVEGSAATQAINEAVDAGIVYLSAAGNNGSISYTSDFRRGEQFLLGGSNFETHDFDPGPSIDSFQEVSVPDDGTLLRPLFSSYPTKVSDTNSALNSLTIVLLDSPELPSLENIKAISTPFSEEMLEASLSSLEYLANANDELYYTVIRDLDNGPDTPSQTFRWVSTANGIDRNVEYEYVDPLLGNPTVYGQANLSKVITVGSASDDRQSYDSFASRGSVPILFDDKGNRLPAPIISQKPDVIAPDNVETAFPEDSLLNPFVGTSAAVANVAGVVALMEQAAGGPDVLSPELVKFILGATDKPVEPAPGLPPSAGVVQPDLAVLGAKVAGQIASIFPDAFT